MEDLLLQKDFKQDLDDNIFYHENGHRVVLQKYNVHATTLYYPQASFEHYYVIKDLEDLEDLIKTLFKDGKTTR